MAATLVDTALKGARPNTWLGATDTLGLLGSGGHVAATRVGICCLLLQQLGSTHPLEEHIYQWLVEHDGLTSELRGQVTTPYSKLILGLRKNQFTGAAEQASRLGSRAEFVLHSYSGGLLGVGGTPVDIRVTPDLFPGAGVQAKRLDTGRRRGFTTLRGATLALALHVNAGGLLTREERALLERQVGVGSPWAEAIHVARTLAIANLRRGALMDAVRVCGRAARAYGSLDRLRTSIGSAPTRPLRLFRRTCAQVLGAFEPPIRVGKDPVRTLAMAARRLKRKRKVKAGRTIQALDAIITVGRSAADHAIERRVVRELARMLHARVLLHYSNGQYHKLESQEQHTLSTWTIRTLVRERRFVARRIKRRPEFWRPEQRRPEGLLSFPIGDGTACLARKKPFGRKDAQAVRTVLRFLRSRLEDESRQLDLPQREPPPRQPIPVAPGIVGESRAWRRMLDEVWRLAPSATPVFVRGETGAGKELTARALHLASPRSQGPFIVVNCAAISDGTMLSELFGHVRGSFSGAHRNRKGLFEQAHRGTLFLDELAEMPHNMQAALLRALEERTIRPVGSTRARPVDVRIVSATNQDIDAAVATGTFREDLYHRLCALAVTVPPLRERMSDLPAFAEHFLRRHDPSKRLHVDCLPLLHNYSWPGNLRELHNVLQAAALLAAGPEIEPDLLRRVLRERTRARTRAPEPKRSLAPRADAILQEMGSRWWTCREIARAIEVSVRTANRDLAELCDKGLVEARGQTRQRRYRRVRHP